MNRLWFWFMVFNIPLNNISVISWRSVLLVEETGVPGENPLTCRKSLTNLSHNVVSRHLTMNGVRTQDCSCDRHLLHR